MAEICQLSAIDQSGLHCFNEYMLPFKDVDIHASRVNGLSVRKVNGIRTLHKESQPVISGSLEKALDNFVTYLEKQSNSLVSDNNVSTVLIGYNSRVFDTPTHPRQARKSSLPSTSFSVTVFLLVFLL